MRIRNTRNTDITFPESQDVKFYPYTGVLVKGENYTEYIFYNIELQKFKSFYPEEAGIE